MLLVAGLVASGALGHLGWQEQPRHDYQAARLARLGFFGLDDLSYMIPPGLDDITKSTAPVSLVGDAEGFLYPIPSSRLHYRTVFDLPGDATDMYQAWLGVPRDKAKGLIVIHPMEVQRLSKTYYHVPGLPPNFAGPLDRPSIEEH